MIKKMFSSGFIKNGISNYICVAWMGGVSIIVLPYYLHILGPQQWGIVAICISIQSLMYLADAGMSQIMPRDIARCNGKSRELYVIYKSFLHAYSLLAIIVFSLILVGSYFIIDFWLVLDFSLKKEVFICVVLLGLQFLFQFPNNANIGYWNGTLQQHKSNIRQCFFFTLKHIVAICLVTKWPQAILYQSGFLLIAFLESTSNTIKILFSFDGNIKRQEKLSIGINKIFRESGVLSIAVAIGLLVTQLDRIVLSKYVDISDFGYYVLASTLAQYFLQLQYPLLRLFFPRLTVALNKQNILRLLYSIIIFCVFPCLIMVLISPFFLSLWLDNAEAESIIIWPLRLILIAIAINSIYNTIYQIMLIKQKAIVILCINISSLLCVFPTIWLLSTRVGVLAGGIGWVLCSLIQLFISLLWLFKRKESILL